MNRMQALIVSGAGAFLALVLVTLMASKPTAEATRRAPDLELPAADGSTFSLTAMRGRAVLINFWATWCPPCVAETPSLEAAHRQLQPKGLEVVGVSVDSDWDVVRGFMSQHGVSYRVVLDPRAVSAHRFGTYKYPETYLIGRDGMIRKRWVGPVVWTDAEVVAEIEAALQ